MSPADYMSLNEYLYSGEVSNVMDDDHKKLLLNKMSRMLNSFPEIRFAYIHGSFVKGKAFRDVDIAVYYDDSLPTGKQLDFSLELGARLSHEFHFPVDVHSLNRASPGFCYEATRGMVLVSRDDGERFDFMEKSWMEYFDYQHLLKQNLHDLIDGYNVEKTLE